MQQGATVIWQFPEFDMQFPVRIIKVENDRFISFAWGSEDGTETTVEISLEPRPNNETLVRIEEKSKEANEAGIKWYGRNTEGWANFLACLKAYLEYGINLRKGAFDIKIIEEKTD